MHLSQSIKRRVDFSDFDMLRLDDQIVCELLRVYSLFGCALGECTISSYDMRSICAVKVERITLVGFKQLRN